MILAGQLAVGVAPYLKQLPDDRQNVLCTVCAMHDEIARNCVHTATEASTLLAAECPSTSTALPHAFSSSNAPSSGALILPAIAATTVTKLMIDEERRRVSWFRRGRGSADPRGF